jgi:hypothetical protein
VKDDRVVHSESTDVVVGIPAATATASAGVPRVVLTPAVQLGTAPRCSIASFAQCNNEAGRRSF